MLKNLTILCAILSVLISCQPKEEFEPNNLISQERNDEAEGDVARESGPPLVESIALTNKFYKEGEDLILDLVFHKKVVVLGAPRIKINLASGSVYASYLSGSTTKKLRFSYTVGAGDLDLDGVMLVTPVEKNSGSIKDYAGQEFSYSYELPNSSAVKIDAINPSVTSVLAPSDGVYITAQSLDFVVNFDESVNVTSNPRLVLTVNGVTKYANYVSGSGTSSFIFRYIVTSNLLDSNGINMSANLNLTNGSIKDLAGNAINSGFAPPDLSGVNIDSTPPTLTSFTIDSGSSYTSVTSVNTQIISSGADEVYIGTGCGTGGSWAAYNTTVGVELTPNSTNTLFVQLRDSAGNTTSCQSDSIVHDNLAPDQVGSVAVSNSASDIISDLNSWSAVTDNGPSGVDHYEYAVSTSVSPNDIIAGGGWFDIGNVTSHQQALTLSGGGTYYTLIKAVDRVGNESAIAASSSWNVTLSPEQLTNLAVVNRSFDSIRIGWGVPDDNGTPISDYIIQFKENGAGSWVTINDGFSSSTKYTHTGLSAETSYHYRVRAFNGTNYGAWSTNLITETLPNIDFFNGAYKAINIGGATANQIVSFTDNNEIYKDGILLTTLNRGQVFSVPATDFTVIEASEKFFIAGRRGSGGDTNKANMVWATSGWVGKEFYISHGRSNPMKIKVYAFTTSNVVITKGGVPVTSELINEDNGFTFTVSDYGSYEINSDGFIVAYAYANGNGSQYIDPKPILPASTDIIGIPSSSGKLSSSNNSNSFTSFHSLGQRVTGTANTGITTTLAAYGTSSLYQAASTRVIASSAIVANSYADANGSCSAPFVPTAFQKKNFGLNVQAEWTAFASTQPAVVTVTEPGQTPYTITLTGTSSYSKTPFKHYISADLPAGTLFESSTPYQMWYEPQNDTNAADNDETVMFGWD